jgi:hypothetical protein
MSAKTPTISTDRVIELLNSIPPSQASEIAQVTIQELDTHFLPLGQTTAGHHLRLMRSRARRMEQRGLEILDWAEFEIALQVVDSVKNIWGIALPNGVSAHFDEDITHIIGSPIWTPYVAITHEPEADTPS